MVSIPGRRESASGHARPRPAGSKTRRTSPGHHRSGVRVRHRIGIESLCPPLLVIFAAGIENGGWGKATGQEAWPRAVQSPPDASSSWPCLLAVLTSLPQGRGDSGGGARLYRFSRPERRRIYGKYASASTPLPCGVKRTDPSAAGTGAVEPRRRGVPSGSPSMRKEPSNTHRTWQRWSPPRLSGRSIVQRSSQKLALDQSADARPAGRLGLLRKDRPAGEIHHVEGFLDVQRPRLAVGAHAVPVEQPEGDGAGLLDFSHQQPWAQGVHGPRGQKDAIARHGLEAVQQLLAGPLADRFRERFSIHARLKAGINDAAWLGGHDDRGPCTCRRPADRVGRPGRRWDGPARTAPGRRR